MRSERLGWKREWTNDCKIKKKQNNYKKLHTGLSCLGVLFLVLSCLLCNCCWLTVCTVVVDLCVLLSYVYLYCVCVCVWIFFFLLYFTLLYFTLNAGLLATGQYSEGPVTGHLDTGFCFSWFPCAQKQMLRWLPRFQVATTCFSCSPPDLNLVVTNLMFRLHVK